ncbi:MAG: VanZ family protein [Chitinophagaceae bacterium]|nr:VanZ family protein [Chitinophagaceae bacterium]
MKIIHFIPAFIFFIISVILLCLPGTKNFPAAWWFQKIPQLDKLVHIGLFGLLSLLFHWPAMKSNWNDTKRRVWFWVISCSSVAYGTVMEFVQRELIINRSFEEADILADSVGAFVALAFSLTFFLQQQPAKAS